MTVSDKQEEITICKWCGRRLGSEYYFKCKNCGSTYCYIHRSKHQPSQCKTIAKKSKRTVRTKELKIA